MTDKTGNFLPTALPQQACVTWSLRATDATIERARKVAALCRLPSVERGAATGNVVVVVENAGAYVLFNGRRFLSHPGMGLLRVRRMAAGDRFDHLLKASGVKEGDQVLDATFGLGQDALVLAAAAGGTGKVTAVEASPVLTALALAGMPHWPEPAEALAARIDLRNADHATFLAQAPERSFDVVVIDPMFRHPKAAQPGFDLLRSLADDAPLSVETLQRARHVARRLVVVKDAWPGKELKRLGLEILGVKPSRTAAFLFGVATASEA